MEDQMNKAKFLDEMQTGHARWEELLAQVGEERMMQPGVEGEWSVKDIIAHVTFYERWITQWLQAAARGEALARTEISKLDTDQRNAKIYRENRGWPFPDVLLASRQAFQQLLESVQALPEAAFTDPGRFEQFVTPYWQDNPPFWECIAGDSYDHYLEHIPAVRAWLDQPGS
jgi:hypothetical protein